MGRATGGTTGQACAIGKRGAGRAGAGAGVHDAPPAAQGEPEFTAAEKAAYREQKHELSKLWQGKLTAAVGAVTAESHAEWMRALPRFPNFTIGNYFLIMMQNPHASKVQSASAWRRHRRFVPKTETAIYVLGPQKFMAKVKDRKTGETRVDPKTGQDVERMVDNFGPRPEFDYAQTIPLPDQRTVKVLKNKLDRSKTVTVTRIGPDTGPEGVIERTRTFDKHAPMGAWAKYRDKLKAGFAVKNEAALEAAAATYNPSERTVKPTANPSVRQGLDDVRELCARRSIKLYREGVDDRDEPEAASLRIHALTSPNAHGFYTESETLSGANKGQRRKAIYIASGASDEETLRVALHEIGHHGFDHIAKAKEHGRDPVREELEAEGFAYVAACYYGVESDDSSANYVTNWATSKGGDKSKAMTAVSGGIQRMSKALFAELEEMHATHADAGGVEATED